MKRILIIVGIAVLAGFSLHFFSGRGENERVEHVTNNLGAGPAQPNPQNPSGPAAAPKDRKTASTTKLADTQYAPYSYLVSGDTLDAQAQRAISGFTLLKDTLSDGLTKITLKATVSRYRDQAYTLHSGEQLYFIETSFGDDPGNQEFSLSDDTAVVVDKDGYIVR